MNWKIERSLKKNKGSLTVAKNAILEIHMGNKGGIVLSKFELLFLFSEIN